MTVVDPDDFKKPWFHRTRWVWSMISNRSLRRQYIKDSRRGVKFWYKYESKPILIAVTCGLVAWWIIEKLSNTRVVRLLCRWPTQDFNQLILDPWIVNEKNKSEERAEHLSKLLQDTNYHKNLTRRVTDDEAKSS